MPRLLCYQRKLQISFWVLYNVAIQPLNDLKTQLSTKATNRKIGDV